METAKSRKQERAWRSSILDRPIWWLTDQLAEDGFAGMNRDLILLVFQAMSFGNLLVAVRILLRLLRGRLS